MTYAQRLAVNTLTFVSLSVFFPWMIHVKGLWMAIVAAFVLSIFNTIIKPILLILSFPITLVTFGLFSFVINALMLKLTSSVIGEQNFAFSSFGAAILVAMIMTVVNAIVNDHKMKKNTDFLG